jgi:hypothetical protein
MTRRRPIMAMLCLYGTHSNLVKKRGEEGGWLCPLERSALHREHGDTELVFLESFASEQFMDVSLNQWPRRVPSEMLKAHLNIDKETALKIPAEKLAVI